MMPLWIEIRIFDSAARPEAGSGCPMLDFVEPISKGLALFLLNMSAMAFSSCGSPALVPVPCAST
ncbi:hypothetical protein BpHYR1_003557 [Brachionus plicatilis]|uniref:Uncharacterized protein n=1 Tax=Brachionus plicatilis TaxID=10195 RepID=A0A3M7QDM6_BRAPC|nr:hypothetical protein BpHYR1_003557 [Brachionus plicatilis]